MIGVGGAATKDDCGDLHLGCGLSCCNGKLALDAHHRRRYSKVNISPPPAVFLRSMYPQKNRIRAVAWGTLSFMFNDSSTNP